MLNKTFQYHLEQRLKEISIDPSGFNIHVLPPDGVRAFFRGEVALFMVGRDCDGYYEERFGFTRKFDVKEFKK